MVWKTKFGEKKVVKEKDEEEKQEEGLEGEETMLSNLVKQKL